MIPIFAFPGEMIPGVFGPMSATGFGFRKVLTFIMSKVGMPSVMHTTSFTPADGEAEAYLRGKNSALLRDRVSLWELLRRPEIKIADFMERGWIRVDSPDIVEQLEIQAKYEGYINKQQEQVERFERMENKPIHFDMDYDQVYSLSNEALQKLKAIRPQYIDHASRSSGVTPADINILLIFLEKMRTKRDYEG